MGAAEFKFPVRVYYEDTDAGGLVYHANYLKYYERARTEFLSNLGIEQDGLLAKHIGFVVKRITIDNVLAAKFNDRLTVVTKIHALKRARIEFEQRIERSERVINTAIIEIACVDLQQLKPIRIPEFILGELQSVC
ncbi:tol-pal system-associated acyl-CoA thioesterase [Catenovulum agarivorans DS-2]|uniref:Tol-pal system-associated acyl-CoA thioesterase n=1 Tax=Catenovulum agarivorans DS-2 TaxID=1328313 RepID=W7QPW9_9ALTE|nr:tol-pal system-associated acyl-CoA thioesterase [Catenovulum agarivorans]EWH11032.1 tol-pal system-associated acyl-CoA thioesterase [Catenovulum agarivorans DS-2]